MSKKIVGVTVGTPLSPSSLRKKLKPVNTVNGIAPDENGNVKVEINGISDTAKALLVSILRNSVYTADMSAAITRLETLLNDSGDTGDDSGSISVTKNGTTLIISGVSGISTVKQTGTTLALT